MNTDQEIDLLTGPAPVPRDFMKEETRRIIGCAFDVLNEIGHGLYEKIYENALVVDFGCLNIPYEQQRRFDVVYKSQPVGYYIPDLIVSGQVMWTRKPLRKFQMRNVAR